MSIGDDGTIWNEHWDKVQTENSFEPSKSLEQYFIYLPKGQFNILEIGCGFGKWGNAWQLIGGHYYGIDFSEVAIKRARDNYPNCQFILGDNLEIEKFGISFQVVYTCTHLQHVNNMKKNILMDKIHKCLSFGGIFIPHLEKDDITTTTTMEWNLWKQFIESHGFKLEVYLGTNKGAVFRKV